MSNIKKAIRQLKEDNPVEAIATIDSTIHALGMIKALIEAKEIKAARKSLKAIN